MANQQKPLTYLSLKCVLQYCKADLRILLSQHFPFIYRIEKFIPLEIETLYLEPFVVRINDTEYRLETIRKFPNCPPFGSFQCDLDEFGVPDRRVGYEMKPFFDDQIVIEVCSIKDQTLETLEFIMTQFTRRDMLRWDDPLLKKKSKFAIPELVDPSYCDVRLSDYVYFECDRDRFRDRIEIFRDKNTSGNPNFIEFNMSTTRVDGKIMYVDVYAPNSGLFLNIGHRHLSRIQRISLIEQLQAYIFPLQLRLHNIKPTFNCYLQLTTVSPRGRTTELVEYNQKIDVTMEYLNEKIFGGRGIINVNHLELGAALHLPTSLKIKLSHLKTELIGVDDAASLVPFLADTSFPLKSVESSRRSLYGSDSCHPIIATARKFIIPSLFVGFPWHLAFPMTNPHIHLKTGFLSVERFIEFLQEYQMLFRLKKRLPSRASFGITSPTFAEEVVPALMKEPHATIYKTSDFKHFNRCFSLPLDNLNQLNIFGLEPTREEGISHLRWTLNVVADVIS